MASVTLDKLLRQSQQLAAPLSGSDLPHIQLGLDQIESQSRLLAGRAAALPGASIAAHATRAHASVTSAGADADKLARNIEAARADNAYEPLRPVEDTDVDGYLRHEHQQVILSALEEGRRNTQHALYCTIDRSLDTGWDTQKRRIIEDLGSFTSAQRGAATAGSKAFPAPTLASSSLQMHSKMFHYVHVVQRLNDARLAGEPFPLVNSYASTVAQLHASAGGAGSGRMLDAWSAVQRLVREHDVINGHFTRSAVVEREYAPVYTDPRTYLASSRGLSLRQKLIQASMRHLETTFAQHVAKSPGYPLSDMEKDTPNASLGSPLDWVGQYCARKLQSFDHNWPPELELVQTNGFAGPIWAYIYFLVRFGKPNEALKLAQQVESVLRKTDHSFVGMFQAWLESPGRILPRSLRERLYTEYTSRVRPAGPKTKAVDPYKVTIYRLMGRFDVRDPFPPVLISDPFQWLWLQLAMVRELPVQEADEVPSTTITKRDTYTLGDVAAKILDSDGVLGSKSTAPYDHFRLLLLVGQFERAIAFLASRPTLHADAVQFAIALSYYGLLRVPPGSTTSQTDYLMVDTANSNLAVGGVPRSIGVAYYDFARLIQRYIRPLSASAPQEALQHVYLVALNSDAPQPVGQEQVAICVQMVQSVVLESKYYYSLLGDPKNDGSVSPGSLMKYAKLLHTPNPDSLFTSIVDAAAVSAEDTRPKDAVLLYGLAGKDDKVLAVLAQELGAHLFDRDDTSPAESIPGPSTRGTSLSAAPDLPTMAQDILTSYQRKLHTLRNISAHEPETVRLLLELKRAVGAYHAGDLERALGLIEVTGLIPLRADVDTVTG